MSKSGGVDATVTEFLELEEELSAGTRTTQTYDEGTIARAHKIPANDVPEDYPVPIGTAKALRLDISVRGGEEVVTYQEWPGASEESDHVEQLLDALGRDMSEFADIYGDRVALDSEDGWHGIDAKKTTALRGAQRASGDESLDKLRNLLAGAVGASALALPLTEVSSALSGLLMMVTWVAIPALIYKDAGRVEEVSGWAPEKLRWTLGSALPILNVPVGAAYLLDRHVRLSGTTSGDISDLWFKTVLAGIVIPIVGLLLTSISAPIGASVFTYGLFVLPFAVYFDAEYVEDATDWDPSEELWAVASLFLGPIAGFGYLLKRQSAVN